MIEFKNVNKTFVINKKNQTVLNNINLTINDKDIFGIIGFSGAGKSTLVRLINGLEKPSSGEVLINGVDLTKSDAKQMRQTKKKIGMIFQNFNLLETKTVAENVGLPLLLSGVKKTERDKAVDELLKFVELSDKKNAYPSELSGGQKQRVSIARALINKPDILLCDEATSALDPQTTRSILDLLQRINKEQQVTIVLVTHEMSVVKHICNNIIVMEKGNIIEQGRVLDLFQNPASPVTKRFISSVISDKLPESILDNFDENEIKHVFRFEFTGESSKQAVINEMFLKFKGGITLNILFSNMVSIKKSVIGYVFVKIDGKLTDVDEAIHFLKSKNVKVTAIKKEQNYV